MSVTCAMVRMRLPSTPDPAAESRWAAHLSSCLRCQAEQARYRALRRRLGELASHTHAAPAGLVVAVDREIVTSQPAQAQLHGGVSRSTMAAAAGAAVVAAAAVLVTLRRARAA